jgi:hypothetical protein
MAPGANGPLGVLRADRVTLLSDFGFLSTPDSTPCGMFQVS